jgi:hypothetical protein
VPGRSRMKVVCENGRYWYALVPFPALKPTKAGVPPWPSVVSPPALKKVFVGYCLLFAVCCHFWLTKKKETSTGCRKGCRNLTVSTSNRGNKKPPNALTGFDLMTHSCCNLLGGGDDTIRPGAFLSACFKTTYQVHMVHIANLRMIQKCPF